MTPSPTPLAAVQARAVEALRLYLKGGDDATKHLREAATAFVEAREHFYTGDNRPDWKGATYAYRSWMRETYSRANVPREALASVQAAARYHAGNILRDGRLTPEELEDLGLRADSPRERSVTKRGRQTMTLSLFGAGGREITEADDVVAAFAAIESTLRRVSLDAVAALPATQRRRIAASAEGAASVVDRIARALTPRRVTK